MSKGSIKEGSRKQGRAVPTETGTGPQAPERAVPTETGTGPHGIAVPTETGTGPQGEGEEEAVRQRRTS